MERELNNKDAPSSTEYLREIKSWRFLTNLQLSLLFGYSEKTVKKTVDRLLEENLIVKIGSVTGSTGSWLQGRWLTTKQQLNRLKKKKRPRGYVKTSQGFEVPVHHLAVSYTVGWILKTFPILDFIPESVLQREHGWYWNRLPQNINADPFPTYVPDALAVYEGKYFRLEVQLHNVLLNHFGDMVAACHDNYPILVVCKPGRRNYFLNLTSILQDRISIVELYDNDGLRKFLKKEYLSLVPPELKRLFLP